MYNFYPCIFYCFSMYCRYKTLHICIFFPLIFLPLHNLLVTFFSTTYLNLYNFYHPIIYCLITLFTSWLFFLDFCFHLHKLPTFTYQILHNLPLHLLTNVFFTFTFFTAYLKCFYFFYLYIFLRLFFPTTFFTFTFFA